MNKPRRTNRFTAAEMELFRLLWDHDTVTLAEAHQAMLASGATIGYTTVQTRLERLVDKGVVGKSATRPASYHALVGPSDVSGPLLDLLKERVSGIVPLVAHLLQNSVLTEQELREMRQLIADAEQRCGKTKSSSDTDKPEAIHKRRQTTPPKGSI
ncbi:BlaI/MecI/CopY family transcriptional regulator [Neorhodopirellula pilleata]|nr:BlaI/MecI/CopY family transcriptional regulator [Neorhodopirellula pilleata]